MKELKTLKDFEGTIFIASDNSKFYVDLNKTPNLIDADKLRQEAINWIKELDNDRGKTFVTFSEKECGACIKWIKHFFNISEEDLK